MSIIISNGDLIDVIKKETRKYRRSKYLNWIM